MVELRDDEENRDFLESFEGSLESEEKRHHKKKSCLGSSRRMKQDKDPNKVIVNSSLQDKSIDAAFEQMALVRHWWPGGGGFAPGVYNESEIRGKVIFKEFTVAGKTFKFPMSVRQLMSDGGLHQVFPFSIPPRTSYHSLSQVWRNGMMGNRVPRSYHDDFIQKGFFALFMNKSIKGVLQGEQKGSAWDCYRGPDLEALERGLPGLVAPFDFTVSKWFFMKVKGWMRGEFISGKAKFNTKALSIQLGGAEEGDDVKCGPSEEILDKDYRLPESRNVGVPIEYNELTGEFESVHSFEEVSRSRESWEVYQRFRRWLEQTDQISGKDPGKRKMLLHLYDAGVQLTEDFIEFFGDKCKEITNEQLIKQLPSFSPGNMGGPPEYVYMFVLRRLSDGFLKKASVFFKTKLEYKKAEKLVFLKYPGYEIQSFEGERRNKLGGYRAQLRDLAIYYIIWHYDDPLASMLYGVAEELGVLRVSSFFRKRAEKLREEQDLYIAKTERAGNEGPERVKVWGALFNPLKEDIVVEIVRFSTSGHGDNRIKRPKEISVETARKFKGYQLCDDTFKIPVKWLL